MCRWADASPPARSVGCSRRMAKTGWVMQASEGAVDDPGAGDRRGWRPEKGPGLQERLGRRPLRADAAVSREPEPREIGEPSGEASVLPGPPRRTAGSRGVGARGPRLMSTCVSPPRGVRGDPPRRTVRRSAWKCLRKSAPQATRKQRQRQPAWGMGRYPAWSRVLSDYLPEGEQLGPKEEVYRPRSLQSQHVARAGVACRRWQEDRALPGMRAVRSGVREFGGGAHGASLPARPCPPGSASRGARASDGRQEVAITLGGLPLGRMPEARDGNP